ncbi:type 2 glycerol-3-phosphate oxidase [Spiroplasma endosymbiont of Crioceris asparagi]|uniref:type 2 glycerol-3-phosphate oxidase n=1 Tax=Spiroplasma endosymbiont of Crioceris asparagi TaxID=3066286 RepID=UPI0030CBE4B1
MKKYDVCIIGAGIIGASISRELSKYNLNILHLEANAKVGIETSQGNSGLVHGGFDPTPGKLNAKLNVLGKKRYEDWIKELTFPYLRIDSTIVAFNDEEVKHLKMLYERGIINGLDKSELKILDSNELRIKEPNISHEAVAALVCNSSIAVDAPMLAKVLMTNAIKNSVDLHLNEKVVDIKKQNDVWCIKTNKNEYESKIIINVAGHYADKIAKMAGFDEFNLVTRRGEYRILEKTESGIVNSVVFMVPTIHGKGVIVAPMLDGHVMVGPTAEEGVPKDETRLVTQEKFDFIGEIGKKLISSINMKKTCMTFSGSRPIEPKSDDFWIKATKKDKTFINVAGMKSPAIASAPAIADYVIEELIKKPNLIKLEIKPNFDPIQKMVNPLI